MITSSASTDSHTHGYSWLLENPWTAWYANGNAKDVKTPLTINIKTYVDMDLSSWIDQTRVVSYEFKNKIASSKRNCELEHIKWELGIDLYELGE